MSTSPMKKSDVHAAANPAARDVGVEALADDAEHRSPDVAVRTLKRPVTE